MKDWEGLDKKWIQDSRNRNIFYNRHKSLGRFVLRKRKEQSLYAKVVQFVVVANDGTEIRFT